MATYPDGALLKAGGPEVHRMEGGPRRWVPDPATFHCMGLRWGDVQTISDSEWNQIPKGAPYPSGSDWTQLQASGPGVFVMAACKRRWIPDEETFGAGGYDWNANRRVSDNDLKAIAEGPQIPSVRAQLLDGNLDSNPVVDGYHVYFQGGPGRDALYRRPNDGSGAAQQLDNNCGSSPAVDGNYVYFEGGPLRDALYRRPKDGSGAAQQLDNNCGSSPVVDGNYVYFQGGPGRDALYRRPKDGSGAAQQLDDYCGSSPAIDGNYVYFKGGPLRDALYRRPKDGSGTAQQLDDYCGSNPMVRGEYVYFLGGSGRDALHRRLKDGGDAAEMLDENCGSAPAVDRDYIYFKGGPGRDALYRRYRPARDLPDVSAWMTANAPAIRNLPLWQIAMPGAHDAGSYGRFWMGVVGDSLLGTQEMAQAQGAGIGNQLAWGMRYFDLRFLSVSDHYYVQHGVSVTNNTLDTVLHDIKTFLDKPSSSGEILILDTRWSDTTLDDEKALVAKVCDACGRDRVVTKQTIEEINARTGANKQYPASCTPQQLWDAGKQVIILWGGQAGIAAWKAEDDADDQSDARYIWLGGDRDFQISKYQATASTLPDLIYGRNQDLVWWSQNYETIQRENNERYWWRLGVHTTTSSLPAGAAQSLPTVLNKLRKDWKTQPWNIVAADLFWKEQYIDLTEAVVRLDGQFRYKPISSRS